MQITDSFYMISFRIWSVYNSMIYHSLVEEFAIIMCFIHLPNLGNQLLQAVISVFATITFFFAIHLENYCGPEFF